MPRRTLLLIAAGVAALLGVLLIVVYVQGIDARARKGQEIVEVLYTRQPITLGTSGAAAQSAGSFELRKVPRDALAQGAISNVDPIAGLVALSSIAPGQPVSTSQWGQASNAVGLSIPGSNVAISIQLTDTQRVAGFVSPGSDVAIYITRGGLTNILLPRVKVLAVGSTTASGNSGNRETIPSTIFTLAVSQRDGAKVLLGQSQGTLSFAALSKDSQTSERGRASTSDLS
jgi:pilus assembly protein CpaB